MNCQQVQHHLDSWVRGELDGATGGAVAAHVEACAACNAEADLARHLVRGLRKLRTPAPAALVDRILLSAVPAAPSRRIAWFTPLRALAAVLIVGVVVVFSRDRADLMQPMNPSVVMPPQPVLEMRATPDEPAPPDGPAAAGAVRSDAVPGVSGEEARTAGQPAAQPAVAAATPVLRRSSVLPAPAPEAAPRSPEPRVVSMEGRAAGETPKAFTAAEAPSPAAMTASAPAVSVPTVAVSAPAEVVSTPSPRTVSSASATGLAATDPASGYTATASVPSRVTGGTTAPKLFLRTLSADDNLGVTSFTQSHQLRSTSRNAFRDTTTASITTSFFKR